MPGPRACDDDACCALTDTKTSLQKVMTNAPLSIRCLVKDMQSPGVGKVEALQKNDRLFYLTGLAIVAFCSVAVVHCMCKRKSAARFSAPSRQEFIDAPLYRVPPQARAPYRLQF